MFELLLFVIIMLNYAVFNIHRLRNIHEREVRSAGGNIRPTTVPLTLATPYAN